VVGCGVAIVEVLVAVGLTPLGPLGFPGIFLIFVGAFWGASGAIGGAAVMFAYFLFTLGAPQRFPHFFANPGMLAFWITTLGLATTVAAVLRGRLVEAQALALKAAKNEAELTALTDYRQWLNTIIDNTPALIGYIDAEQRFKFNNRTYEHWLEKPSSEITGRTVSEVYGETEYLKFKPHLERALRGGRVTFHHELWLHGEVRHAQTSFVPNFDPAGRVRGCFVVAKDIGSVIEAQRELREAQQRYELALGGSSVALWDVDLQTGKVYLGEAWAAMSGAPAGDTLTTVEALASLIHPEDREAVRRALRDALKGTARAYVAEHRMRAANGEWKWILSRGRVTQRDASGRALRMIGTNVDIHERKLAELAVERRVQDDVPGGVASQSLLVERLRRALARARRTGSSLALIHLDIERFRPIADALGPQAAETLLNELAGRLRACVRLTDTVARLGTHQFVVLLDVLKERSDAFRVVEKMLKVLREPVPAAGSEVRVTANVGVAFPDTADTTPEELIKRAGSALESAKSAVA
jgi:diguanylate cyclase (GGDEF)-like protein/PAS domain S-box-containing protein